MFTVHQKLLNRKKCNITKLIHRTIYSSISKMIEIKVQCAVITKYYFCQKQIASHALHERKAATYVQTQQMSVLDNGIHSETHLCDLHLCRSIYASTPCKSTWRDSVFGPSQNGQVFLTVWCRYDFLNFTECVKKKNYHGFLISVGCVTRYRKKTPEFESLKLVKLLFFS